VSIKKLFSMAKGYANETIYVDANELLKHTKTIVDHLSNADRVNWGSHLIDKNIAILEAFSAAYSTNEVSVELKYKDELHTFSTNIVKKAAIDKLYACYNLYATFYTFIFENVSWQRISAKEKELLNSRISLTLGRLSDSIARWRGSVKQQVLFS